MKIVANTPQERIQLLLAQLRLSPTGFEKSIGVSNGFVKRTSEKITPKMAEKIKTAFPEVNMDWLRYGVGSMLDIESINIKNSKIDQLSRELQKQNEAILLLTKKIYELQTLLLNNSYNYSVNP